MNKGLHRHWNRPWGRELKEETLWLGRETSPVGLDTHLGSLRFDAFVEMLKSFSWEKGQQKGRHSSFPSFSNGLQHLQAVKEIASSWAKRKDPPYITKSRIKEIWKYFRCRWRWFWPEMKHLICGCKILSFKIIFWWPSWMK